MLDIMSDHVGNSKKIKNKKNENYKKKNQVLILGQKNIIPEIKISLDGINSILNNEEQKLVNLKIGQ